MILRNFKKLKRSYALFLFFLFFLFLTFIKIDYRISEPNSAGTDDDVSYLFHAQTIAQDFDLDYSNQIDQNIKSHYLNKDAEIYVPRHPLGAGLLSSPFLALGLMIENQFNLKNLSYFFYSLSSIFYLFLSFHLLTKVLNFEIKNNYFIFLVSFFGSGISYYAFERFSMTHVYEVFSISLIFYLCWLIEIKDNKKLHSLIVFILGTLTFVFLSIRWTNYFLFLIPLFYFSVNENISTFKSKFIKNKYYYLGLIVGLIVFLIHTKLIYGLYTINPNQIYSSESIIKNLPINHADSFALNFLSLLFFTIKSFFVILFSFEFGLFFISPIIFLSYIAILYFLYKKQYLNAVLLFVILLIPTMTVIVWQTTASSFGFRYLFCLIPIGVIVIFKNFKIDIFLNYLKVFGVFSLIALLFFETNSLTILQGQTNTFGVYHEYSAPKFVVGILHSIFSINSYLKIIFTSYLGVLFFKILNLTNLDLYFLENIDQLGYLNEDVLRVYNYSNDFYYANYLVFLFLFLYFIYIKIKN